MESDINIDNLCQSFAAAKKAEIKFLLKHTTYCVYSAKVALNFNFDLLWRQEIKLRLPISLFVIQFLMYRITSFHVIQFMFKNTLFTSFGSWDGREKQRHKLASAEMLAKSDSEREWLQKAGKPKAECRWYLAKYAKNLCVCVRKKFVYSLGNKVLFHRMKLIKNLTQTNWSTAFNHFPPYTRIITQIPSPPL